MRTRRGASAIGHLLIPHGDGPFPAVVAFEILDGPHDVSEGLAKALVDRGYAVARLERRALDLAHQSSAEVVRERLREGVIDARRLLDWLVTHPKIDRTRIAAAGVSVGSIQALLLAACDPRIRGGFYLMTGGNLAEIFYDSSETPVREFRDRLMAAHGWTTREEWVAGVSPLTRTGRPAHLRAVSRSAQPAHRERPLRHRDPLRIRATAVASPRRAQLAEAPLRSLHHVPVFLVGRRPGRRPPRLTSAQLVDRVAAEL